MFRRLTTKPHSAKLTKGRIDQGKVLLTMLATLFIANEALNAADLTIDLDGAKTDDGLVMVAIANSEASFGNEAPGYASLMLPVHEGRASVTLHDLPAGEYAIQVFHDADSDGELGTNLMGIPTESYGFSNNAQGSFGPPSYADCRFDVTDADVTQRIDLR